VIMNATYEKLVGYVKFLFTHDKYGSIEKYLIELRAVSTRT